MTNTVQKDSPQSIPRDQWEAHPNFPEHALLLGSHESFRQISRHLRQHPLQKGAAWLYRHWKAAMANHERYEEEKLYPYLEARWGVSMDRALAGHKALHNADLRVRAYLEAPGPALEDALTNHDEVLKEHLALEEEMVIPLLLQLSRQEFDTYYHSGLRALLEQLRQN